MLNEKIVVNYKNDKNYLERFKSECDRLKTFSGKWKENNNEFYWDGPFANDDFFIRLGGLQKAIKQFAYFYCNYNDHSFGICLNTGFTWEDVINRMKEIDSIEV